MKANKTGGGRGTNQHAVKGTSKAGARGSGGPAVGVTQQTRVRATAAASMKDPEADLHSARSALGEFYARSHDLQFLYQKRDGERQYRSRIDAILAEHPELGIEDDDEESDQPSLTTYVFGSRVPTRAEAQQDFEDFNQTQHLLRDRQEADRVSTELRRRLDDLGGYDWG